MSITTSKESKNPRRSKSPRRDLKTSGPIPPMPGTSTTDRSWTVPTSLINVEEEEPEL